jgi:hypothetical protein
MARLRTATTADEIIDALCDLGRGRREGPRSCLTWPIMPTRTYATPRGVLRVYRGGESRRLRERLPPGAVPQSGLDALLIDTVS